MTPSQQAILEFAEECGTLFDSEDGFATVTVDAAVLHEYVWKVAMHSRLNAIRECEQAVRKELARCGTHLYPDDVEAVAAAICALNTPTKGPTP